MSIAQPLAIFPMPIPLESSLMEALRQLGATKLAWSLRRLYCPVPRSALVLEVGSGGNPYPRANVLLDAYEVTRERHWAPLVHDRPTVLGFVEKLPFRDKAFDFVIASHVLEHSSRPEVFLAELARVAKAGYIETPDAFMERINPYRDHRLEVTERGGRLLIRKKASWAPDRDLVELYEARAKDLLTSAVIPENPFLFHTRFYWKDAIPFEIINPEDSADWPHTENAKARATTPGFRGKIQVHALRFLRKALSQTERNRKIDLSTIAVCPDCKGPLTWWDRTTQCPSCHVEFTVKNGIPLLHSRMVGDTR